MGLTKRYFLQEKEPILCILEQHMEHLCLDFEQQKKLKRLVRRSKRKDKKNRFAITVEGVGFCIIFFCECCLYIYNPFCNTLYACTCLFDHLFGSFFKI